ncbi:hypothetical protein SAMN05192529_102199 [Arachidicoccus rhizosphaerae]|uniref:Peptidase MA superfamily protein n=1 Tax=Arachidicoccus rhizosphaerae TaxID=551991 RepID=A0A1H3W9G0_9BACT|nr:hypothetical protein [Arachidicoccus rhizosphaerae]SDZ83054.1 hypothetical protein SAMN05192529_102199 [Arachidicoccus rhizosphaerae]
MSKRRPHDKGGVNCRQLLLGIGIVLSILLLSIGASRAQQFGGNPPSLKWRQLKNDSINIIFPKCQDTTALKIAAQINYLRHYPGYSLGPRMENPPILIQTETANSNGYVGMGPYRSEFYLSSPMDVLNLGSLDWASTLALHEYRHIMQYDNINIGLTRVVDFALGDNARSLFSDMAVPNWFFEGDAVYSETLHSTQGRGRLPRFMNIYPVLKKDGKNYNYQKLRNGSYKDLIPGHYNLGYILVAFGYQKYGDDFWGRVIRDAARYKGLFYPFQKAIQRQSGISFKRFREQALSAYQQAFDLLDWKTMASGKMAIPLPKAKQTNDDTRITPINEIRTNEVVDYMYPYPFKTRLNDGQDAEGVVALKTPSTSLSHFVLLQNGTEKKVGEAPISRDGYFGYNDQYLIYTRFQVDPRWSYKEYSDLEILDVLTGQRHRITHKSRYFTPDITLRKDSSREVTKAHPEQPPTGMLIAASRLTTDEKSSIDLLDARGQLKQRWTAPKGVIYNYPKFFHLNLTPYVIQQENRQGDSGLNTGDAEGNTGILFMIRQPDGRMGIGYDRISSESSTQESNLAVKFLVPLKDQLLAYPVVSNGNLFYSSVEPTKDNPYTELWQLDLSGVASDNVTSKLAEPILVKKFVRDGAQGFIRKNKAAVISLQTAMGYRLFTSALPLDKDSLAIRDKPSFLGFKGYLPLKDKAHSEVFSALWAGPSQAKTGADTLNMDQKHTLLENEISLSKWQQSIKKYPLLSHPFHFHSLQPSVEDPVYALKLLGQNTLNTLQTTLSYNYNRVTEINAVGADMSLGLWYLEPFMQMDYSWNHQAADSKGNYYGYQELTSQLGVQLPLNFTGGRWSRSLYVSTALSQSDLYWSDPAPKAGAALTQIRYLFSRVQYSVNARQSSRQFYPRWGLYTYSELNSPLDGKGPKQWMTSSTIYLPGILPTHSFRWNLAYQNRDTVGAYGYSSRFPFSRGYTRPSFATMWKFGLDYDLPICYPDFGFASMAYFSRIRANVYFDQSYGFDNQKYRTSYGSVGGAVYADMNLGNQYPITIGLRYNYLLHKNYPLKNNWEFILPIHIF